jgi:hypothetical protein
MKRKLAGGVAAAAVGALLGAAAAALFVHALGKGAISIPGMTKGASTALVMTVLMFTGFLALALHELGHLIAGRWVGFRLHLYVVGPLRIERGEHDRLRLRFNRDLSTYGGMCASLPTDERNLLQRFAFVVAGGPVVSLLAGALAFGAGSALHALPGLAHFSLLLFGMVSTLIGVVTSIPMPNGAYLTDGARWLRLRRGGPLAERDEALLHCYALTMAGRAPADWPEALVAKAIAITDDSIFEGAARYFAYAQALEQNRVAEAESHLDRCLAIMGQKNAALAMPYRLESAWFAAWHRNDPATAQALLEQAGKSSSRKEPWDRLRAKAAIALRTGDQAAGRDLLKQALTALPDGAMTRCAKRQMLMMQEIAD